MKKINFIIFTILFAIPGIMAQTPEQFKYQAVLRDASGNVMTDQAVTIDIAILEGSATGVSVFNETHIVTTSAHGVINLNIGSVNDMGSIDWSSNIFFVEISVNDNLMGASQLLSVPYAISAKKAETADYEKLINLPDLFDGNWSSLSNTPTTIAGYGITDVFSGDFNALGNKPEIITEPNILIGTNTGENAISTRNIIAIGNSALLNNGEGATIAYHGADNVAIGFQSLQSNTLGYRNTANGMYSLWLNYTGYNNNAFGYQSLYNNTAGSNNIAVGSRTLYSNITGSFNTASGSSALISNTTGNSNTAMGYLTLEENVSGVLNTAVGRSALASNTSGGNNTAIGSFALFNNITGSYNTAIGQWSGPIEGSSELTNTGAFGNGAGVTASNTIRIGNSSITQIGGAVAWSNLSDGRFKTNVKQNVSGLDFIMKLKPVTYNWDLNKLESFNGCLNDNLKHSEIIKKAKAEKEAKIYTGFIAQEVEKAANESRFDFSGIIKPVNEKSHYNLSYAEFVAPIVKAIQEQQEIIKAQQKQIQELKKDINELKRIAVN